MTDPIVPSDKLGTLLALVQQVCTKSSIQKLLRDAKDAGGSVRISGSKEQVIFTHLRQAVELGTVLRENVYQALCAAEENGSQHIFYYRVHSSGLDEKYSNGEAIAAQLLGDNWRAERLFPKFELKPTGVVWSDFRIEESPHPGGGGWAGKLYAGINRWTFVSEQAEGEGRTIRIYEKTLSREIYLARWHNFGLLELRVPRNLSTSAILESLAGLWTTILPAVNTDDFDPLDLTDASRKLIDQHSPQNGDYRLGDAHFVDGQMGSARFAPPSEEDDVMSDSSRESAIRFFNTCRELAVVWLPTPANNAIEEELRTVIGKIRPNEILIASKATAGAVDYVTHRLWQLAR